VKHERVIIAGPRDLIPTFQEIRSALVAAAFYFDRGLHPRFIITGGADGVDTVAYNYAKTFGIQPVKMEALWDYHRKQGNVKVAGPKRNSHMAEIGDCLIAIRRKGERTRGTSNMIKEATIHNIPVLIREIDENA
jgi:hypothetical protein